MRLKYLFLALTFVFISGCQSIRHKDETATIKIVESQIDSIDLSSIFGIRQIVKIDTSVCILGRIIKVKCDGDDVYVWDNLGLHRFSENGKNVFHIGNKGRGHEEYVSIGDFDVRDSTIAILDMYKKVLLFDINGNYKSSTDLDFYAVGCLLTPEGLILTSGYQEMTEKFHVLRLSDLKEISAFGECRENDLTYRHFIQQQYFYRDEHGRLLYHELMNNTVSLLSEKEIKPLYEFDLYGKTPPAEFWNHRFESVMDVVQQMDAQGYCYGLPLYAVGGDTHFFMFTEKGAATFTVADTKRNFSSSSQMVYFDKIVKVSSYSSLQFNLNSDSDISICVPSEKYYAYSSESEDNPVIIRLFFRDR